MNQIRFHMALACLLGILCVPFASFAGWDVAARVGYDSNVLRSIDNEVGDGFAGARASFSLEPSRESRASFIFSAEVDAVAYDTYDALNGISLTIAPGLEYVFGSRVSATISPFLTAKATNDPDQSAFGFGGRAALSVDVAERATVSAAYSYADTRARVETYSSAEHEVGMSLAVRPVDKVFVEVGGRLSRGETFRVASTSSSSVTPSLAPATRAGFGGGAGFGAGSGGTGTDPIYSSSFNSDVVRDLVDGRTFGATLGVDWTGRFSTIGSFVFSELDGDIGVSRSQVGSLECTFRF